MRSMLLVLFVILWNLSVIGGVFYLVAFKDWSWGWFVLTPFLILTTVNLDE